MLKWFKNILGIIILAFLVYYLSQHWHQLKVLLKLRPLDILALYFLTAIGTTNNARIFQLLLRQLNAHLPLPKAVLLQSATRVLNYIPMKFGTVFRVNYLKRFYGLSYTDSITVLSHLALLTAFTAGLIGLVSLVSEYGLQGNDNRILALAFLGLSTTASVFYFVPFPVPKAENKFTKIFKKFITGRQSISRNLKTTSLCIAHFVLTFVMSSLRFWIIYRTMDVDISPVGCLVLGAVGFGSVVLGLTPGSLGIREVLLGSAAVVIGIPLEVGILAAMFD
ncbi:MAG: flippase-like domain-containing protein, partial [Anaerohalosphaera sp.]|nr:flippase-like domain-containing protein [Anaerohalosphaera sp.]